MLKKIMFKREIKVLALIILLAMSSACSKSSETNVEIEKQSPASIPTPILEEDNIPEDNINSEISQQETDIPDSQIEKEDGFVLPTEGMRPFAVMIDNEGTRCIPQGGINMAQVIYEIIVEGGVSRIMPVFWEQEPQLIGPVRSSRHYFLDYAMEHDAIYVHFGWSPMAMTDISKFKINNINGVSNGGEIFWDLTNDRKNWQDSYTSTEKIKGYVKKAKYRTETEKKLVFKYNDKDVELENGDTVEEIKISYSTGYTCGYTYDEQGKKYLRLRKNEPQMDRVSEKQLTAKNIIIQKVRNYTIKDDTYGRQDVNTVGEGEGYYITNGKYIKIKWSKSSRSEKTTYTDIEGNNVILNPGQTWVQIVPKESKIDLK